jgi:hypothetical protein
MSVTPPGVDGTMMLIGFDGYVSAKAGAVADPVAAKHVNAAAAQSQAFILFLPGRLLFLRTRAEVYHIFRLELRRPE